MPASVTTYAAMDPEALRRAWVEFRVKLGRDTETNLTAADCETLLFSTFRRPDNGEEVTFQTDPARFYASLWGGDRGPNAPARPRGPLEGRVVLLP